MLRWEKAQVEAKLERLEETEDKLDLGDLAEVKTQEGPEKMWEVTLRGREF